MKRSKFSLSYSHLLSCDMGELVPIGLTEVLPGDSLRMNSTALVRCAPMLAPPMHPVHVCIHHWFVPHRLVFAAFESFITGGADGNDATVFPFRLGGTITQGSLENYLGLPVGATTATYSALPRRGYNLIWNEWYRDQDLQTALIVGTNAGQDGTTPANLQNVCWEKDYFTSSRPWEQKGAAQTIPLSGSGVVSLVPFGTNSNSMIVKGATDDATPATFPLSAATSSPVAGALIATGGASGKVIDPNGRLTTSLTGAGITVNNLRQTLAIQRYQEAAANYGSRYVEYLSRLGVRSSDGRLSRPEYLGGGRQTLQFSEVLQTAADGANPVSTLRGHGITAMRSNAFNRFFEEHGYVFTLMYCKPKTIYMNSMPRTWNRRTKFDFWQKEFEFVGQQGVLNKEVRAAHATPDGVFGYQDRYDEYRRSESRVSGEFSQSSLDYWHFGRAFSSDPALNATFVSSVPTDRPFAAPSADVLYVQVKHNIKARRLVSANAVARTF